MSVFVLCFNVTVNETGKNMEKIQSKGYVLFSSLLNHVSSSETETLIKTIYVGICLSNIHHALSE